MKIKLSYAIILVLLMACKNVVKKEDRKSEERNISVLFNEYWEQRSRYFPLEATQQGDNRYNHILINDQTKGFRDSLSVFYATYATKLDSFNREELSANDQISYDIFKYEMQIQQEGLKTNQWMIPFQQFWGLPITIGQLGSGEGYQPFKTEKDYKDWLGRMHGFSAWTNAAIENFRQGIKAGVVLPKALVLKMIPQMDAMLVDTIETSLFYSPTKKFPKDFSDQAKTRIAAEYKATIEKDIIPSYRKLRDFLQREYLPKARSTSGISALPQGKSTYQYLVKYWTTTDKSPEEIYKTGLEEVNRIREEMERVKSEVNFAGDLKSFFEYMRTNKRFTPFKSPEDVLNAFRGIYEKIEPNLNRQFGRKPKTPFEIRQTEAFRAASASAEYMQGSPDGKRPGIFYVPILDAKTFNITSGMESLFLHEAIPGHHYQISLQQENENLPKFRRFSWYGAYGEGWALYCESLGKELGLYTDPYQYMGALGDEMHRAVRLVVDVGIHTKGMTREQAIKYMMENQAISEEGAIAEIERYMAIPGQALSYKIGALKIWELRKSLQEKKGKSFRIADFHDDFLKDGCMPLEVVEQKLIK